MASRAFSDAASKIGTSAKVYYASKALLTTDVVRWVDAAGLSIDVSTSGELAVALAAGIDGSRIGLHGNNKSLVEIGRAVAADLSLESRSAMCPRWWQRFAPTRTSDSWGFTLTLAPRYLSLTVLSLPQSDSLTCTHSYLKGEMFPS